MATPGPTDGRNDEPAIPLAQARVRRLALLGGPFGAHLTALGQRAEGTRLFLMSSLAVVSTLAAFFLGLGRVSMLPVLGVFLLWGFTIWQTSRIPADSPLLGGTIAPEDIATLKRRFFSHAGVMLAPLPEDEQGAV